MARSFGVGVVMQDMVDDVRIQLTSAASLLCLADTSGILDGDQIDFEDERKKLAHDTVVTRAYRAQSPHGLLALHIRSSDCELQTPCHVFHPPPFGADKTICVVKHTRRYLRSLSYVQIVEKALDAAEPGSGVDDMCLVANAKDLADGFCLWLSSMNATRSFARCKPGLECDEMQYAVRMAAREGADASACRGVLEGHVVEQIVQKAQTCFSQLQPKLIEENPRGERPRRFRAHISSSRFNPMGGRFLHRGRHSDVTVLPKTVCPSTTSTCNMHSSFFKHLLLRHRVRARSMRNLSHHSPGIPNPDRQRGLATLESEEREDEGDERATRRPRSDPMQALRCRTSSPDVKYITFRARLRPRRVAGL
ncbi:hypothetical protein FB45DRAFT_1097057 [Roridomyces roridus]|uniref:Uncharacterized protein n=1 Tax=Roridomyces roridus TaxID=1738132 RepID=A0AAD7BEQ1_9AGAR|nr:hypothetical protein FB45DRAFT_1097057 [Roridomyces roridus]